MMSSEQVDACDPVKLARRYYDISFKDVVFLVLTQNPWHPEISRDPWRTVGVSPEHNYGRQYEKVLGKIPFNVSNSQITEALMNLVDQELRILGWKTQHDYIDQVNVFHPKTPDDNSWWKRFINGIQSTIR